MIGNCLQELLEYKFSIVCCAFHTSNGFYYVNSTLQRIPRLTYIVWKEGRDVQWNLNFHIWYTVESLTSGKKKFRKTLQKVSKFHENDCSFKTFQQPQSWLEQLRKIHYHRASKKHLPNKNWYNKRKTETTRQIDR